MVKTVIESMRFTLLISLILPSLLINAQDVIKVAPLTDVKLSGNASIVIEKMNLLNDGNIAATGQSSVVFTGNSNNDLSGIGVYSLQNIVINKSSTNWLRLKQHIEVSGLLQFQSGLFDLDNYSVDFGSLGSVSGETELSRAHTIGSGYLRAVTDHGKAGIINPGNLGASINSPTAMGITEVKRGHSVSIVAPASSSIMRWYTINPTINTGLGATLNASYFDEELNSLDEQQISFWKSSNNTDWSHQGFSSRNVSSNQVELTSIQSFSKWTLAHPPATQTCNLAVSIPDAYALSQGVPPNTVFLGYPGAGSIILTSQLTSGTAGYSYSWKNLISGQEVSFIATATVQPVVNTTYLLTVTDANGCTATATKLVTVIDARCGNKGDKVPVCLNGPKPKTICVAPEAVEALIQNGATLGPCGSNTITKTKDNLEQGNDLPLTAHLTARAMPNPSAHDFSLLVSGKNNLPLSIRVFDNSGRMIEERQNVSPVGVIKLGASYHPGSYMVEVLQGGERITIKLVKGLKSF